MKRNVIKQILREEVEYEVEENLFPYTKTTTKTSTDISVGLMHKSNESFSVCFEKHRSGNTIFV